LGVHDLSLWHKNVNYPEKITLTFKLKIIPAILVSGCILKKHCNCVGVGTCCVNLYHISWSELRFRHRLLWSSLHVCVRGDFFSQGFVNGHLSSFSVWNVLGYFPTGRIHYRFYVRIIIPLLSLVRVSCRNWIFPLVLEENACYIMHE